MINLTIRHPQNTLVNIINEAISHYEIIILCIHTKNKHNLRVFRVI